MQAPLCRLLPDQRRLHLSHGPIDLIIEASGPLESVRAAYRAAERRFATILEGLCAELTLLRAPAYIGMNRPSGVVAQRMVAAVLPYAADCFITPMAAVAGAVADEILSVLISTDGLRRAYVNNGGDIALFLAPGARFDIGIVDRIEAPRIAGTARITAASGIGGIATSGWGGRSFSLGIADAVTCLGTNAAAADAAATIIANAIDLPSHKSITRQAAISLQPDSDLGHRPVTVAVGPLSDAEIATALERGRQRAESLIGDRLIAGASMFLKGRSEIVGTVELNPAPYIPSVESRTLQHHG
jgi:ApbE superfamily uncharacterized protein (UPF0280 family)